MNLIRPDREFITAGSTEGSPGRLPVLRIGVAGGAVGMLCCAGPTALGTHSTPYAVTTWLETFA
ncbi:hypothetical protein HDA32_000581 [Spinactinospora alkalitolerans]|uniref:Uncharacterized protein n=1 Tax=Spinactinospora alkalitolerans TaxID=687207 RepID=A0A852TPQ1_9ACTN|nr:hypothetical protein [Spinactinospora alkalitolerans]NYE45461.1 hypothetical protein [Spinactinospora alkalitolerans]